MVESSRLLSYLLCSLMGTTQVWADEKPLQPSQELDCIISPSIVTDLGSSLPGVLRSISVDRSDLVQAGDVIAKLDSDVERVALKLARTQSELDSEIDLQRTNVEYGDRRSKRYQELYLRRSVSELDLDLTQTEAKLAEIRLHQAQDKKRLAKLEHERAREILNRRSIVSPITGVVVERYKQVGEYVEDQSIARIAQLSPLHVDVIMPISQVKQLQPGMSARVWSDLVEGDWLAQVDRIDRVADPASGTIGVRLLLDNPDYLIPAGIRCRMQFLESTVAPPAESKMAQESVAPQDKTTPPGRKTVAVSESLVKSKHISVVSRLSVKTAPLK